MNFVKKSTLVFLAAFGSFSLIACANSEPATNTSASSEALHATMNDGHNSQHQGHTSIHTDIAHAQIFTSGPYHLELIAESKGHGVNLYFHLESNTSYEPILGAKVTALVQMPTGNQETLNLQYEAEGEHYVGSLETQAKGEFRVTIMTDINGEKVSTNYSFNR